MNLLNEVICTQSSTGFFFHYKKTAVWEHLKTHRNLYRDALHAENYEDSSKFVAVSLD